MCYHRRIMSPFPTWTTDDVRAFLLGYGLRPETLTAVPLEAGNLALLLHADGQRLVLRRYSWTPEEEIARELQLIRFLTARGFPTPSAFRRIDGAMSADFLGRPAALFPYVVGHQADPQSPADAAQVADAIAELHLLTRGLHLPHAARARTGRNWRHRSGTIRALECIWIRGGVRGRAQA